MCSSWSCNNGTGEQKVPGASISNPPRPSRRKFGVYGSATRIFSSRTNNAYLRCSQWPSTVMSHILTDPSKMFKNPFCYDLNPMMWTIHLQDKAMGSVLVAGDVPTTIFHSKSQTCRAYLDLLWMPCRGRRVCVPSNRTVPMSTAESGINGARKKSVLKACRPRRLTRRDPLAPRTYLRRPYYGPKPLHREKRYNGTVSA